MPATSLRPILGALLLGASLASPSASASGTVLLHIGAFEARSPSARNLAAEVANQATALARGRRGILVTQAEVSRWNDPARATHEGALLRCLDPWSSRREVLGCLRRMQFPPPLDPIPDGTQFLITGSVSASDEGMVVDAMLHPVINGEPGIPVASRSVVVPWRGARKGRIKRLAGVIAPLLDQAQGLPPRGHAAAARPRPPPPPADVEGEE